MKIILFILTFFLIFCLQKVNGDCAIKLRDHCIEPQPLYVRPESNTFWPTTLTGQMVIKSKDNLEFFCPQGFARPFLGKTHIIAKCENDLRFAVGTKVYQFSDFVCKGSSNPTFTARETGQNCVGGKLLEAGYEDAVKNRFFSTMKICFDKVKETTLYVHHKFESDYYQKCARSVKFQTAGFFEDNVDRLYSFNSQKSVISKSLGVAETKYFDKESNLFLSRGHLAGKGDFVLATQQLATFLFVNVAPQWQTFNGGNWNSLENNIRALSLRHTVPLEFYSGTIGISSLPNSKNVSQEIYLHDTKTEKKIPVPKLYFRVILEQEQSSKRRKGVVVIGVNNPHANPSEIQNSYKICEPDVIDKLSWLDSLKVDLKNNQKGYLYACEVKDFVKNVKFLPPITNVDQLLI